MSNGLHIKPERETRNNHLEWTSPRLEAEVDENRESSAPPMASETCNPHKSNTSNEYSGEGLDFGSADVSLI